MKELRDIPESIFKEVGKNYKPFGKPLGEIETIAHEFYQSGEPKIIPSFMLTLYKEGNTYYMEQTQGGENTWYLCIDTNTLLSYL